MKKIIITTFMLAISTLMFATENGDIQKIVSNNFKVPAKLKNEKLNEKVNVQFKFNNNGELTLINVNSNNEELKNYVEKQFKAINLKGTNLNPDTIYSMNINFRVL